MNALLFADSRFKEPPVNRSWVNPVSIVAVSSVFQHRWQAIPALSEPGRVVSFPANGGSRLALLLGFNWVVWILREASLAWGKFNYRGHDVCGC